MSQKLYLWLTTSFLLVGVAWSALAPGEACSEDIECPELYVCKGNPNKVCTHKSLFPNSSSKELGGAFMSLIANSVAASNGFTAGGFLIPYLVLLDGYTANTAIVLGFCIAFGGSIGALADVIFKKNPTIGGPLINYNILMICIPAVMSGVPVGMLLNQIEAPILTSMLGIVLVLSALVIRFRVLWTLLKKEKAARIESKLQKQHQEIEKQEKNCNSKLHTQPEEIDIKVLDCKSETDTNDNSGQKKHEHEDINPKKQENQQTSEPNKIIQIEIKLSPNQPERLDNTDVESNKAAEFTQAKESKPEVPAPQNTDEKSLTNTNKNTNGNQKYSQFIQKREHRRFPLEKILILFFSLIVTIIMQLLTGNSGFHSIADTNFCSSTYWGIYVLTILIQICIFLISVMLVFRWQNQKVKIGWEFLPEDLKFTPRRVTFIFIISFLAGLLGGVLGTDGGLIVGPLFLIYGVSFQTLSATTTVFIFFIPGAYFIDSLIAGAYPGLDLAFFLPLAVCFSFIISKFRNWLVRKTQRPSMSLIILLVFMCASFVMSIVSLVKALVENRDLIVRFHDYC